MLKPSTKPLDHSETRHIVIPMSHTPDTFINQREKKATSTVRLASGWEFSLYTHKDSRGYLSTTASMGKIEDGFVTHRVFQDFHKHFLRTAPDRITNKALEAQHTEALKQLDTLILEAEAHQATVEAV